MILNQVARVFTMKGSSNNKKRNNDRHRSSANNNRSSIVVLSTNHIFRRQKTASVMGVPNEIENNKDDPKRTTITTTFISLKKIYTNDTNDIDDDDDDIVSVTSNSTIDLTPSPVLPRRRVRTSSPSMTRTDIITILPVPKLFIPFDNNHDENNNNVDIIDDTTTSAILPVPLPVRVRFTTHRNDDNNNSDHYLLETALAFDLQDDTVCTYECDEFNPDSDCCCDDSCIFAPPPVQVVCVPDNFRHADAFVSQIIATPESHHQERTTLFLTRPPTRLGEWDHHTIESNDNPDDADVLFLDNNTSENCVFIENFQFFYSKPTDNEKNQSHIPKFLISKNVFCLDLHIIFLFQIRSIIVQE